MKKRFGGISNEEWPTSGLHKNISMNKRSRIYLVATIISVIATFVVPSPATAIAFVVCISLLFYNLIWSNT